jgi:hypothetical protein
MMLSDWHCKNREEGREGMNLFSALVDEAEAMEELRFSFTSEDVSEILAKADEYAAEREKREYRKRNEGQIEIGLTENEITIKVFRHNLRHNAPNYLKYERTFVTARAAIEYVHTLAEGNNKIEQFHRIPRDYVRLLKRALDEYKVLS